jgi:hypothetical protein
MRFVTSALCLVISFAVPASLPSQEASERSGRIVQVAREKAEFALTLVCSLEGVFQKEQRTFYFRRIGAHDSSGYSETQSTNADGGAGGYGLSLGVAPTNTGVDIKIDAYWNSTAGNGKIEVTIPSRYFEDQSEKKVGITYSLHWAKLR